MKPGTIGLIVTLVVLLLCTITYFISEICNYRQVLSADVNEILIITSIISCLVFICLLIIVRMVRCTSKNYQTDIEGYESKSADVKYQDCVLPLDCIFGIIILLIPTICAYLTDKHGDMSTWWFWTRIGVYVFGIIFNIICLLEPAPDM